MDNKPVVWMKWLVSLIGLFCLAGMTGCQQGASKTAICGDESRIWELCQDELHKRGFEIAYRNRAEGVIVSEPRLSSQWFEFWGQDLADGYSVAESSCQSIRRQVRFAIKPEGGQSCCQCEVVVERMELSADPVDSSFRVGDVLRRSGGAPELREGMRRRTESWVEVGKDPALAQALLASLQGNLEK